jgi:RNA polymerase sporulation-specific sigma factor
VNERAIHYSTGDPGDEALSDVALVQQARIEIPGAFDSLFHRYRRRVAWIAKPYFVPGADRDDLIQEATIGFFKAVRDYRSDRGSFAAFVELCVRRQIITFIKTSTRAKHMALNRAISLDAPAFDDSDSPLSDRLQSAGAVDHGDTTQAEFLHRLWERCSNLERGVLSLYTKGYSFEEMARELSVHWKAIDNAVWRVKVKAKKLLSEGFDFR